MGSIGSSLQRTYDMLVKGERPEAPQLSTPPLPPSPTSTDPEQAKKTADAMEAAAAAERRARGRASTLLTGASGLTDEAPTSRRMLLGS